MPKLASTCLVVLCLLAVQLPAQKTKVAVVELFTSEGCSSCPPADALLQKIHLKSTSDGRLIIGISEHVTYWNGLGWKDPFSSPAFTERQAAYALKLSTSSPYTPQAVVDGRYQLVGSNASALAKALQADANRPSIDFKILSATLTGSKLDLEYALASPVSSPVDILAIVTDDSDRSNVLRGENSGRSLQHISVARMLTRVRTVNHEVRESAHLKLPQGIDLKNGSGHHLILLAQEQKQGAIVAAAIQAI